MSTEDTETETIFKGSCYCGAPTIRCRGNLFSVLFVIARCVKDLLMCYHFCSSTKTLIQPLDRRTMCRYCPFPCKSVHLDACAAT